MKSLKLVLQMTTALVLCFPVICSADQTDQRLDGLFQTLQTSQDAEVLLEAEAAIWEIWYESGKEAVDSLMLEAAQLVRAGDLGAAEAVYSRVIEGCLVFPRAGIGARPCVSISVIMMVRSMISSRH